MDESIRAFGGYMNFGAKEGADLISTDVMRGNFDTSSRTEQGSCTAAPTNPVAKSKNTARWQFGDGRA